MEKYICIIIFYYNTDLTEVHVGRPALPYVSVAYIDGSNMMKNCVFARFYGMYKKTSIQCIINIS